MTEKELQILGFEKEQLFGEDSDAYYYIYDVSDGLSFISVSSDEVKKDQWYVDVFNTDPVMRFHDMEKIQALINIFEKAKI